MPRCYIRDGLNLKYAVGALALLVASGAYAAPRVVAVNIDRVVHLKCMARIAGCQLHLEGMRSFGTPLTHISIKWSQMAIRTGQPFF